MAARVALVVLAAFLIFQVIIWESQATVIRRDVSDAKSAGETIDEAVQSFKSGLDDLVKNIQGNEFYQNATQLMKSFGEQVEAKGKELVEKVKSATKTD